MAKSIDGIPWTDFVPGRATLVVLGLAKPRKDEGDVVQPESYFMASSELLGFLFVVVWLITYANNYGVVNNNPIKDRLGYNNFCVGLDSEPAKNVGEVLFMVCYYSCIRYAVTNLQRSFEVRRMGKISAPMFVFSVFSDIQWLLSISIFALVWVIDPWMAMYGHTLPFIGFIYVRYVSVLAMMLQSSETTFKGWVFLVFYCAISAMLPMYYLSSFAYFTITSNDASDTLLPWWVGMSMDYAWFGCLPSCSLFTHIDPVYKVAMQNVMKQSVKDDIENVGSLLVQNSATDPHLTVRDLPKIILAVIFNGILVYGFFMAVFFNS